ncbi:hypothetical protein ACGFYQ_29970 [Streptomyces sp. NPDC048258]|uniref:hypothetical protein n=1 Tax=Streptomyces sp. NPDC048258 TaxID=3365527 RepID=UPI003718C9CA
MRAIVMRTLFAVVLSTGMLWGGAAAASASAPGHGTTITLPPDGAGHGDKQCTVTTAWGDAWCPRKPLD